MKKGLILLFTGNGKGKTTAALGLALRAMGHHFKICMIQFIKGSWQCGELEALKRFEDLMEIHVMGRGFTWKSDDFNKDKQAAQTAWQFAKQMIASEKYQIIILDELTHIIKLKMIDEKEIVAALCAKPKDLHVIITGRDASELLVDAADLVTEMQAVKHPFKAGIKAQKGIEF
ncbi:MAG: cob(I)yrinic acid a,c-diamide adenosyltransferase [Deltaproteobacteria bacterium]|nr:cob(I)yrinic acid a,c-diamide adenosyltransferase [Deltaproteobacteria bacterium]MBW2150321.1 cob(I)yrinic acid a,c-diamide adenosyltransferase [Deltaproteobacteria bacterium]